MEEKTREIKRILDAGKEKKWKGKSLKEVGRQKEIHDIGPVVQLLESKACDEFFFQTEKGKSGFAKMYCEVGEITKGEYLWVPLIKDEDICPKLDMPEFRYTKGTKYEVVWRPDIFEATWADPRNISDVYRRLTVFRRPQRINPLTITDRAQASSAAVK